MTPDVRITSRHDAARRQPRRCAHRFTDRAGRAHGRRGARRAPACRVIEVTPRRRRSAARRSTTASRAHDELTLIARRGRGGRAARAIAVPAPARHRHGRATCRRRADAGAHDRPRRDPLHRGRHRRSSTSASARELGMETVGFLMMSHMARAGGAGAAGADHGRRRRAVRLRHRLGRRADPATTRVDRVQPRSCRGSATTRRSASTATTTSRSASPTRSPPSRRARPADRRLARAGSAPAPATRPTEVLAAVFDRLGIEHRHRPARRIMDAAEEVVRPLHRRAPQVVDRSSIMLGYAGVYSSVPAPRRAGRRALRRRPPHEILLEVGRRKATSAARRT